MSDMDMFICKAVLSSKLIKYAHGQRLVFSSNNLAETVSVSIEKYLKT